MRLWKLTALCFALVLAAQAHFLFILPLPGGGAAEMILSETLSAEDTVDPALAAGARLRLRDAAGNVTELQAEKDGHRFLLALPGEGDRLVYGFANLGVAQRGGSKPHLLLYYPKTILGGAFSSAPAGGDQVVEIVPQGTPGQVRLLLLARGKPLPHSEITVLFPGGEQRKVMTGPDGLAGPFPHHGRYGAWARFWEDHPGAHNGKPYEQIRHYAMLVFDSFADARPAEPLPEKTSSFGAAADSGWLYVYGGHIARTHSYSAESVSGKFSRRKLSGGPWEPLPASTPLQGLNLVSAGGKICRAGGMQPRNAKGESADNRSVAEAACFNPSTSAWESLPPLPEPRSSHDIVSVSGKFIVTGGWTMRGKEPPVWAKTTLILDPANPSAGWRAVPQPFERRALVAAVWNGRVYVIGGITPSGKVSTEVEIYDPATNQWTKGPALPGPDMNGFAPAAAVLDGKLYASAGDGSLFVLHDPKSSWQLAARTSQRLAHRMLPATGSLVLLGGAVKGGNLDLVETVAIVD